jgi:hypothetical protein
MMAKKNNDNDNDSKQLETLLGAVKQKQRTIEKRCFHCNRKGHSSLHCCFKKKKGGSENAGAAAVTRVNKTKTKCSHWGKPGHAESSCWKKYLHKAPSKSSTEASGVFLDEELLVCNINIMTHTTTQRTWRMHTIASPIAEDGQWNDLASRMGMVESHMGQEDPLIADPYKELRDMSHKKTDNADLSDWLELQEKTKTHNRLMKELAAGHMEDQHRSVKAEANDGKWGPQEMGPNKQANKMVARHHGPAYSPESEYGLETKTMMAFMTMLKRSDMRIADSGASNYVTFSDKRCQNKRDATGLTHGIVGESVLPKCQLDIPCVHFDKDGNQVEEVTITDVSHLPEGNFNLFSLTRLQKKGMDPLRQCRLHQATKRGELIVVQHCC